MWDGDDLLGLPHFPTLWSWFSSIQLKIYLFTLSIHILHKNWQWNSISYPMIFHSIIPEINHPAFLGYSHDYGNNPYIYIPIFHQVSNIIHIPYSNDIWWYLWNPPYIPLMDSCTSTLKTPGADERPGRGLHALRSLSGRCPSCESLAKRHQERIFKKIWGDGRLTIGIVIYTLWLFNIAMENHNF